MSISLDGPTIITRPQPISNASTLVWFAAFGALIGAICLGLVIGYSSSAVEQMQTISINRVWVPNENLNVTSSNESSEADDGASSETQGVETNSTDKTGHYQEEYFISSDDTQTASWVSSIITLGALFGAALAQTGSSLLGKKTALCVYGIPFAASWLLIAFAPNVICVLIGRFLTGFFGGIISGTTPSYVCEIATPALRGFLGSGFQVRILFAFEIVL